MNGVTSQPVSHYMSCDRGVFEEGREGDRGGGAAHLPSDKERRRGAEESGGKEGSEGSRGEGGGGEGRDREAPPHSLVNREETLSSHNNVKNQLKSRTVWYVMIEQKSLFTLLRPNFVAELNYMS